MSEAHSVEEIRKHVRVYMAVFGALAVLTVVTVGVAYVDLNPWPALIVALIIALVKGSLVAMYFMHLVTEKKVIFYTLLLTGAFLLFMIGLFMWAYHGQDGGFVV